MKPITVVKILLDTLMTFILLLLMAYNLVGEFAHILLGILIFFLFISHIALNIHWSKSLFNGKYSAPRILQTIAVFAVFFAMLCSVISGLILSHIIPIRNGLIISKNLHLIGAYWGFVLISFHLGTNWHIIIGVFCKIFKKIKNKFTNLITTIIGSAIAGYGIYAFIIRKFANYMFLKTTFVFFDKKESLWLFILDYLAIMGLFVWIGYYVMKLLRIHQRK